MARKRPDKGAPSDNTKYSSRTLQLFPVCKGLDVWNLQTKLIGWGSGTECDGIGNILDPVKVNGVFDSTTRDAVMRFQSAHQLAVTGVVDDATFRAIDREAALHWVCFPELKCPCKAGKNDGKILCLCEKHPHDKCTTGWGAGKENGKYLLDGKKLADNSTSVDDKLDIYDMYEYPGMDKALLWALRALMHRAGVKWLGVSSGYRCWHDNYHHTDERRWRHRQSTFFFGKSVEFYHRGQCTDIGADLTKDPCGECNRIREIAQKKCGFQLRWQEPDRISVGEGAKKARPPVSYYAVHLSSVRRLGREEDDFVKTHGDSVQPLYEGPCGVSLPVDLGGGLDPHTAPTSALFANIEGGKGGWYPFGASRIWHGGVHLFADAGTAVHAIAGGDVVACQIGEAEAHTYGSRNFVLIKHTWNRKEGNADKSDVYYGLYFHLDAGKAEMASAVGLRKQLYHKSKKHVEALVPGAILKTKLVENKSRLYPLPDHGLGAGECAAVVGDPIDPKVALDSDAPADSLVVKLEDPPDSYVFTKLDNVEIAKVNPAEEGLANNLAAGRPFGLKKPIRVATGDVIGKIGVAATDPVIARHNTFLHLETFSAKQILTDGYTEIDITDPQKLADRVELVKQLTAKNALKGQPSGVLLETDLAPGVQFVNQWALRNVVLKISSVWSVDWTGALSTPQSLAFLPDAAGLATKFNEYRWWPVVKADAGLPDETVFHYHPLALLLHIAFAE